jgi:carbamoyl-phosphate synthase large subunit
MPRRTDIESILIIGAGPIIIGQACEFDYSGTQAVKTLRAEGYRVILVNSNPATIMTDPELADATYIEPITPEYVEKIIAREKPDALLPTMGGQTALNCAKTLAEDGTLAKYGVELIGANLDSINKAENRELFNAAMQKIGLETAKNGIAHSLEEAREVLEHVGLPAIIRPSFTLGGSGGGIAYNKAEFEDIVASGLDASPTHEVLIDESVLGWKEYEMEVVRDKADNCIIICSIENIDPMGVHTGDSITVAPALTLTDKEYQIMRNASLAVLREIGVDTGGSNVQFALNPEDGRMVVIEMNPRVSRSSALASKATGFPIAKVAAKLAVGYTLDEIMNDVVTGQNSEFGVQSSDNGEVSKPSEPSARGAARNMVQHAPSAKQTKHAMPASFEPTIDYVVTKIPRFTFEKFPGTEPVLSTAMKSVGEAMAIGRNFPESLQKALRSLETGLSGLDDTGIHDMDALRSQLSKPTPDRFLHAAQALRAGMEPEEICRISKFDPWFIAQLGRIVEAESWLVEHGLPDDAASLRAFKQLGFSDAQLARLTNRSEIGVRQLRHVQGVRPVFKRVDTCAAEFASDTPYMYSCYESIASHDEHTERVPQNAPAMSPRSGGEASGSTPDLRCRSIQSCEANPTAREKIVILGGGPNRIGQGIEFDYCCVHASYALREEFNGDMRVQQNAPAVSPQSGAKHVAESTICEANTISKGNAFETIMINCNPETISTDYDTSDRLYFEPLTAEDVIEVIQREQQSGTLKGVIVQYGGQTPLKLANALEDAGIPIIGTSVDSIDLAEDRERFQQLLIDLDLQQPPNAICSNVEEVTKQASKIGYPVVVRPSYVLGGRAMRIIHTPESLQDYMAELRNHFGDGPILLDGYLEDATELDVDCLCDGVDTFVVGIMEHIEEAGIHSGDSACSLPPYSLDTHIIQEIRAQTKKMALALNVVGLMNVQFAVKDGEIYIIEVNPRASRTVPFVAKATGIPVAKIAARLMAGARLSDFNLPDDATFLDRLNHVAVKEVVFPFARFAGADTILGPEMKSTGETMGLDKNFARAFAKGFLGSGSSLPSKGRVFLSVRNGDKPRAVTLAKTLIGLGFEVVCTRGTGEYLNANGAQVDIVNKVSEGRPHIVDAMKDNTIDLVFNTTEGEQAISDSFSIRRTALLNKVPYSTTMYGAEAMVEAIAAMQEDKDGLQVVPLQEYLTA